MTRGNRPAYTLVEMMVVVAIIIFIATIGMVNYLNFQDRQRLENTAKELIVWLRGIQQKARVGDRGEQDGNNCWESAANIAQGTAKLDRWQVQLAPLSPVGTNVIINAGTVCHNRNDAPRYSNDIDSFLLPQHLSLTVHTDPTPTGAHILAFDAVYGQIYFLSNGSDNVSTVTPEQQSTQSHGRFILTDGQFYYVFLLENGTFTSGCTCESESACADDILKC